MKTDKKFKNTFWFTVYYTVKKNFVIPLLTFLGFAAIKLSSFNTVIQDMIEKSGLIKEGNAPALTPAVKEYIKKTGTYFFVENDDVPVTVPPIFLGFFLAFVGVVLGIILFRFVTNKKTVNVYYSLGIKRSELFTARYAAGAVMLFCAVALPMIALAIGNVIFFGSSAALWKMFFYYLLHYSLSIIAPFTIAAAVSGSVGTVSESAVYSALLVAFPSIVLWLTVEGVPLLLFGAPSDGYEMAYTLPGIDETAFYEARFGLNYSPFGQVMGMINLLMLNTSNAFSVGSVLSAEELKAWKMPSLLPYLPWVIGTVLIFAAGLWLFKHRKAEICGFMGKSRIMNIFVCTLLSFAGTIGALVLLDGFDIAVKPAIILSVSLVVTLLVFCIIELLLIRSFKLFKSELKYGLIPIAVIFVSMLSVTTGFFGYSSRTPDVKDVKSVSISTPTRLAGDPSSNGFSYTSFLDPYEQRYGNPYYVYSSSYLLTDLTSEHDIKTVIDIHKKLISDGRLYDSDAGSLDYKNRACSEYLLIEYTLKNGKKLTREYPIISYSAYADTFKIEDTDRWNGILDRANKELIEKDAVIPVIISKHMGKKTVVDEEHTAGLIDAMYKDIKELDFKSFWRAESEYLGSINLVLDSYKTEHDGSYDENGEFVYEAVAEDKEEVTAESFREEIPSQYWNAGGKSGVENLELAGCGSPVPITPEMKHTVAYLKQAGLYDALADESPIVSAKVASADKATVSETNRSESPLFGSMWCNAAAVSVKSYELSYGYQIENPTLPTPQDTVNITDKATLDELSKNAYGLYIDLDGGYIVEFKHEDGSYNYMYVPEGRMSKKIG